MLDTFKLLIALGNDAMQTPENVAAALEQLAENLRTTHAGETYGCVRDANGNTVGQWELI